MEVMKPTENLGQYSPHWLIIEGGISLVPNRNFNDGDIQLLALWCAGK
jgi:hypothetical protein